MPLFMGGVAGFGDGGDGGFEVECLDGGRSYLDFFDFCVFDAFEGALDAVDAGIAVHAFDFEIYG